MSTSPNTADLILAGEEERRHHQTAPFNAFSPSVLVTAPGQQGTATSATDANINTNNNNSPNGVRTHQVGGGDGQRSPIRAFEPYAAAGASASQNNSRTNSPQKLRLSLAGVDAKDLPAVGSSSSVNGGTSPLPEGANSEGGQVDSASSNTNLIVDSCYKSLEIHDVSNHSKQLKPLLQCTKRVE